jgi:alpha/beta superfamily hydrolase
VLGQQARTRAQDELTILARDPAVSTQLIDTYKVSLATGLNNTHCAETTPAAMPKPGAVLPSAVPQASGSTNKIELSNQIMRLLVARDYATLEANMTATAQSQVPASRLQSIWEQVWAIAGPYKQILDTKADILSNNTFYVVHAKFEKALVNLALTFDEANRVSFILITPLSALPRSEIEHRALEVATHFFQEKFNDVVSGFDATLKTQVSADQLRSFFMQMTNASGRFEHIIGGTKNRDLDVVDVLCQLQGGKAMVRVAYDPDMKVNGFWIMPSK